jgi:hypothetical protein
MLLPKQRFADSAATCFAPTHVCCKFGLPLPAGIESISSRLISAQLSRTQTLTSFISGVPHKNPCEDHLLLSSCLGYKGPDPYWPAVFGSRILTRRGLWPVGPERQRRRSERPENQQTQIRRSSNCTSTASTRKIHTQQNPGLLQHQRAQPIAPPTPPTLSNFLENRLIPCRFRCVGGVGGIGLHGLFHKLRLKQIALAFAATTRSKRLLVIRKTHIGLRRDKEPVAPG